jgi:hypothetical protein
LLLPPVELELELVLELELELEELSLVPTIPDVNAGIAKASTAFLIEPPSVSGGSLSSVSLSVIFESDESELISSSVFFSSSSVIASIFSIISILSSLESDRRILYFSGAGDCMYWASSRSNLFFLNARVSFLFCRGGAR